MEVAEKLTATIKLTKTEKQQAFRLLDELEELGPDDLENWNIEAQAFLIFTIIKHFGDTNSKC